MQAQKRGVLFVYSGPSGVGKGTLSEKLFAEFGDQLAFWSMRSFPATAMARRNPM